MFPLGDIEKSNRLPFISIVLIAINVFVFVQMLLSQDPEAFVARYALTPQNVTLFNLETLLPFITSMFLHGGFFHIFSNMWFLWVFGDNVEERLGILGFPLLYFGSGIVGGILQYLLHTGSTVPMIGASGAVSGVLGAYFILFPHHRIRSVVFLFFIFTVVNIPAGFYLFYWFILQFFQGIASIPTLSQEVGGVAFMAHVGGFVTGVLLALMYRNAVNKEYIEGEVID